VCRSRSDTFVDNFNILIKFVILSDSLTTIKSIQNQLIQSRGHCNKNSKQIKYAYEHGKKITIMWILEHAGIRKNGIVDEQASLAINNTDTPLIEQTSYDDTKKYIKIVINDKWQNIRT